MASVTSLGIHKPSAIPYLVAEGTLPVDPSEKLYKWRTVPSELTDGNDRNEEEEELLITEHAVAWSRGGLVQRVFRFDIEGEAVTEAVFTYFWVKPELVLHSTQLETESSETVEGAQEPNVSERKHDAANLGQDPAASSRRQYKPAACEENRRRRALVVILKRQAHVFFLFGTSYIINLPFEVDGTFPLPYGLLLQRHTSRPVPREKDLPAVPPNSFAYSQSEFSAFIPSSQGQSSLADLTARPDPKDPLVPLLSSILPQTNRDNRDAALPKLYCLTDPLAEISAVSTWRKPQLIRDSLSSYSSVRPQIDSVGPEERLLYVSATDELGQWNGPTEEAQPLLLAATHNQEAQNYTIWSVEYADKGSMTQLKRRAPSGSIETVSRRRSSYGPRASTGANTPLSRNGGAARDSLGANKLRTGRGKDVLSDESFNDDERGLVSHLDSALQDSNAAVRNSRRVSSLVARAELSNSKDRTAFPDLASSHSLGHGSKRGTSFGSQGVRLNVVLSNGTDISRSGTNLAFNSRNDTPLRGQPPFDQMLEDSDIDEECIPYPSSKLCHNSGCLQRDVTMRRIHTIPGENPNPTKSLSNAALTYTPKVFVLKFPSHNFRSKTGEQYCFVCILDRNTGNLTTVQFEIRPDSAGNLRAKQQKERSSKAVAQRYRIRHTNTSAKVNIVDVGKIQNDGCFRLLALTSDADGQIGLSIQSPWTPTVRLQLPSSLNVYNPYRIANSVSPRQQREGSLKRVLSRGTPRLINILHCGHTEIVDVEDTEGIKHRLEVKLQPCNSLVRKMIFLCDAVLPHADDTGDTILTLWSMAMSWLLARDENDEVDTEWTAFVVALFSIVVNLTEDRRSETIPRQKRKGGLLRSSSGASTNLESWEAMLVEERSLSGLSPIWMEGTAWQWALNRKATSTQAKDAPSKTFRSPRSAPAGLPMQKKCSHLIQCLVLARTFRNFLRDSPITGNEMLSEATNVEKIRMVLATVLVGLHLLREEMKLDSLVSDALHGITPILAQLGAWLGWSSWGTNHGTYYMLESTSMASWVFDDTVIQGNRPPIEPFAPPSILQFIETTILGTNPRRFVTLLDLLGETEVNDTFLPANAILAEVLINLTPRTVLITNLLTSCFPLTMIGRVRAMSSRGLEISMLETLPESVALPFRAAISCCQAQPELALDRSILNLIGRDDLNLLGDETGNIRFQGRPVTTAPSDTLRDIHTICNSTLEIETIGAYDSAAEVDRQSITRMIFKDDQRFAEAAKLLHPLRAPIAHCIPEPEWSDTELLEAQQELAKTIAVRTLAVSPGRSCLFYDARLPLLTERFPVHGFTLSCIMKPSNTTVTADKMTYTEEKVSWAFFHAGVEAGLSIAKNAKGIDTSWILYNKPQELKNRHAGFLLALGLNGHLKSIAKWVAFKYLTPKHTMTSIGLLLGLAASYLGTMDTLITRLLSVHVTRMLPPGAAELNISSLTQTSGIMGIGLLYCNTQHRRMSEIMLSEMESVDDEDPSNPHGSLRDEGYRLAAGFAFGFINLGRGKELRGLHDMHVVERLLALAVGTKKVSLVHILDKGTAAAAVALALTYMKTQDPVLARKVDVPDTIHQFDYVRPDVFLLRTVARHLIMWEDIHANFSWMKNQLPTAYQYKFKLTLVRSLNSEDMPFFNIVAGLCLSIGLRHAGSGSTEVRTLLCYYLDQFIRICRLPVLNYDSKLARTTVRNCQDVIALATACVMAGFGDLHLFRRLRSLHGRTETDVPYGSHLAAHLAIGMLFLGGGTHTFGTSNIAIASLLCAFYPLFPTTVLDNQSHLQAFRHFWVLAAEPRCLSVYEIDTQRLIPFAVVIKLKNNSENVMTAPCLLPDFDKIASIQTNDPEYWQVTLDLADNPVHKKAFQRHQTIFVRRCAAYDAHISLFGATMQALNDTVFAHRLDRQTFRWIFTLSTFENFDKAERALILPHDSASALYMATRGTTIDDRLILETACMDSGKSERLWNLRLLFAWGDRVTRSGEPWAWLSKETVEALRIKLMMRKRIHS